MKTQYWCMWGAAENPQRCSVHNSLKQAIKATKQCQKRAGLKHWIVEVKHVVVKGKV